MDKIIDKRTVWTKCLLHYTTINIYHWLPIWCIILFCWCISGDIQLFVHVLICLLNQKHSKIGKHRIVCNICTVLDIFINTYSQWITKYNELNSTPNNMKCKRLIIWIHETNIIGFTNNFKIILYREYS